MRKYKAVEVSETQLEDLVRRAPELIEEGLAFVDHQTKTPGGRLDVLLVDSGRALVIAELKVIEDDAMLVQGIDYYDYVLSNLEGFARAYGGHNINPKQQPRLLLIAPSFSVKLLNRVKWINLPITLFAFKCIAFEDDDDLCPIYMEIQPPSIVERPETHSLDDRYSYITDDVSRRRAQDAVARIKQWDPGRISVEAIKHAVSIKCQGLIVAYVEPRRRFFVISTIDREGTWTSYRIDSDSDLAMVMPIVRVNFDRIVSGHAG